LRKGFMSVLIVVAFAAALIPLMRSSSASENMVSATLIDSFRLEKDYYLRANIRELMEDSLASGGIGQLNQLAEYAANYYSGEGISVSFWCAQSTESGLEKAKKWHLNEQAAGYCIRPLYPEEQRVDFVNACSLMLAVDEENRTVSIVRTNGHVLKENGEHCFYPQLAQGKPSVIGATILYPDMNYSIVVLPEGLVILHDVHERTGNT